MLIRTDSVNDYHAGRTLSEKRLSHHCAAAEESATWKDWARAIAIGAVAGFFIYLSVGIRAGF
ncbi:hypothetical protein [Ralstonia holmesii]|uniref:hypothetical protein n=1 Tax=Ralstonia holmesii TaxID=3058602 RepID=UPI0028F59D61|nr:hypothetical protein [Ralstonia sp. LMG 32967]CAJ0698649.1 hypothetical protein R11007_02851 [Ralstonia sp. LMG 32967]